MLFRINNGSLVKLISTQLLGKKAVYVVRDVISGKKSTVTEIKDVKI